ncbi:MAG: hypothetical protein GTN38_03235 [Candidatus Aenigmarchaeota archaeon]|nr:hypothetical protein [Candidatus Aenigmarchaeota archaeon]NIP40675.1 hypothetical protein [Candidatus Aenigmarchaeota archaeon]NIQ18481.1 hypothetical protein [Candidatus Aenigmarchaeota archaeon]NIS73380.1 hypothetical protein [Candidatus Aenigmarchaeota archaeon]
MGFYQDCLKALAEGLDKYINALQQKYKLTNVITDFTYTGYRGGFLSDVNEIFFKRGEDKIMGAKYINLSDPTHLPTQFYEDLDIQSDRVVKVQNGTVVDYDKIRFDESAELGGSLDRFFKDYQPLMLDSTYLKGRMVEEDINYVGSKMPREVLPHQATGLPSNVEVVRIPISPGLYHGFLKNIDPRGYNIPQIWYRTKQWVVKKVVIDTIFSPALKLLKRLRKGGLNIHIDPIYNIEADLMHSFDSMFGIRKMEPAYV